MQAIIDSPYNLGGYADRLFEAGVRTVIRYYNNKNSSTFPSKCLSVDEFDKLVSAGLNVAVVFQQRGGAGGFLEDFGTGKGKRDASRAVTLANAIGQPDESAIYFGVDHDFFRPTELDQIERYFGEVKDVIGDRFRIGVYGSGAVCSRLKSAGNAGLFWLPASMGWSGSRAFLASQQWTLFQKFQDIRSDFGNFDYDGNLLNPEFEDFGQFGKTAPSGTGKATTRGTSDKVAVFEVIARGGLNLRGGPGEQFEVIRALPLGTIVHGIGPEGKWIQADTNGDGAADGFLSRAFLRSMAGGLPLAPPERSTLSPYEVAQSELALDVREVAGPEHNPRIVMYHGSTSGGAAPDETAWCSSFVNYCVTQAGLEGTNSKWARSWHDGEWGDDVTSSPRPGDIVVWSRRSDSVNGGHVGFFVGKAGENMIRVLGGNQGNRIRISDYPVRGTMSGFDYTLLSIRR